MSYEFSIRSLALTASLSAGAALSGCAVQAAPDDAANSENVASAASAYAVDVVGALAQLTAPRSDRGAEITLAEARSFVKTAERFDADEAIRGIVITAKLRATNIPSDEAYSAIQQGLRFRVRGLATSLIQVPGLTFARRSSRAKLAVAFDPAGVAYERVDLVYTTDRWETTRASTLGESGAGVFGATLDNIPAEGRLRYALHVFDRAGHDFWLNNPRELRDPAAGGFRLDYTIDVRASLASPALPSSAPLARLVRAFTDAASDGGAVVTSNELSTLVETLTWEGDTGIDDPDALNPALAELDRMVAEGVTFESLGGMQSFMQQMRMRTATPRDLVFSRVAGDLRVRPAASLEARGARALRVVYSTDGWSSVHTKDCASSSGPPVCSLGGIPSSAFMAYAVRISFDDGAGRREEWLHADDAGNFFHRVPAAR